jgi:hypothetical protein
MPSIIGLGINAVPCKTNIVICENNNIQKFTCNLYNASKKEDKHVIYD